MGTANVTLYAVWTQLTYTVTYNGNGATGGTPPTDYNTYVQGDTVTVLGNAGILSQTGGYTFAGWNTQANGLGTSYVAGATFTMGVANVTLYAVWTQNPTHMVIYNGEGATNGTPPTDSNTYPQGSTVTVLGNSGDLSQTGYTFAGWNTNSDGSGTSYVAGATFTMGIVNVSLYSMWTQNPTYTVTYNANGATHGTPPTDSNSYTQGASVIVLGNTGNLHRRHYYFAGWNTQANGLGTSYVAGATFTMGTANVTLYAVWQ
jgi:uncharacterized repeat protein (TIGR02543 family)